MKVFLILYSGQTCLSGFPSYDDVTSNSCPASCNFEGETSGQGGGLQLRIFPMMMISCNGELQGLTVAGDLEFDRDSDNPELQIWRPTPAGSMTFNKEVTLLYSFPSGCTSLPNDVQNCTLNSPLFVEVGDIIGILLPRNHKNTRFRIYFNETSTPNHLISSSTSITSYSASDSSQALNGNAQPLIYLHIMPG